MIEKLRNRLQAEEGFTLIELLVVLIIIGILLAIAVPSYLGFKDKANQSAAAANVRAAVPAAEGFYSDNNTYTGLDNATTGLASYDASSAQKVTVTVGAGGTSYCLQSTVGSKTSHYNAPGSATAGTGTVANGAC